MSWNQGCEDPSSVDIMCDVCFPCICSCFMYIQHVISQLYQMQTKLSNPQGQRFGQENLFALLHWSLKVVIKWVLNFWERKGKKTLKPTTHYFSIWLIRFSRIGFSTHFLQFHLPPFFLLVQPFRSMILQKNCCKKNNISLSFLFVRMR